jgi:MFS family permease
VADAPTAAPAGAAGDRPALLTVPFVAVLVAVLAAFSQNFILQPVLPLLIFERGGDATLVGLVFAVFTIPSVALRPWIGRLADRWGPRRVLALGAMGLALAGPFYLVPSLAVIAVLRVAHGTVWAAFNTGAPSLMAHLIPGSRRGEASGLFDLMPGIAMLVMPSVGLLLYSATGLVAPFVVATLLGILAVVAVRAGIPSSAGPPAAPGTVGSSRSLLEPTAVLPMLIQALFMSVSSLFLVYPPLFAAEHGIPISALVVYYPVYGLTLVLVRLASGRYLDRFPRGAILAVGAAMAFAGLVVATFATDVVLLTIAGMLYAAAQGFSAPVTMAVVIDRSPRERLGSAMATYTLGFQFGSGIGAAVWGTMIDAAPFATTFAAGAGIQLVMLLIVLGRRKDLAPLESADAQGPAGP